MGEASGLQNGGDGPARWSLRLLGDFQLNDRGSGEKVSLPGKRERVLLACLALSPDFRQPRRKLVTLLWGEAADETTLDNLRTAVFNLRKALGDTDRRIVASEDRDIVLDSSLFEVDVLALRRLTVASGVAEWDEAAKLYAGDFLEGLSIDSEEFESWRREEATRCRGQVLDVLAKLMARLVALNESERAIETGLKILRLEPLHEAAVRQLMRLYDCNDQRGAAIELYRTLAETLRTELNAQPKAETRALFAELSRGGEDPTQAPAPSDSKPLPVPVGAAPPSDTRGALSPAEQLIIPTDSTTVIARPNVKRRIVGWLSTGGLAAAAAVALLLFTPFAPSTGPTATGGARTVVVATPTSSIALAVLPFSNLSSDPEQEFFSDGLTEEISSALAKVPDLRMVARTSAFEFKGQNRNIRTIGEQLGATHLIEGSVRRAGNRVRVTVQLIRADDGTRTWSDDYDRELIDIFAIQEDIAQAIASALSVPLGLKQGDSLVRNRTADLELYDQYLRAKALFRARGADLTQAIVVLESVVARDAGFAPAWALLAYAYILQGQDDAFTRENVEEARRTARSAQDKAENAAREAIRLDPQHAGGYAAMGRIQLARSRWVDSEELFKRALSLDANDPETLHPYSASLATEGRLKELLGLREKLRTLEPFVPIYNITTARIMQLAGQSEATISILLGIPPDAAGGFARNVRLALAHATQGRYGEAADILLSTPRQSQVNRKSIEDAAKLLRSAPATGGTPELLPRLEGELNFVYAFVGAPDRAVEIAERSVAIDDANSNEVRMLWLPEFAAVRKTERFKALMRNAGLVEYWRSKGWPEFCRPVGADDFMCD